MSHFKKCGNVIAIQHFQGSAECLFWKQPDRLDSTSDENVKMIFVVEIVRIAGLMQWIDEQNKNQRISSSSLSYRNSIKFDDYIPGVRGIFVRTNFNKTNTLIKTCKCELKTSLY